MRIIGFLWLVLTTLHKPLSCTNFYKPLVVWNFSKNLLQACDLQCSKNGKIVQLQMCLWVATAMHNYYKKLKSSRETPLERIKNSHFLGFQSTVTYESRFIVLKFSKSAKIGRRRHFYFLIIWYKFYNWAIKNVIGKHNDKTVANAIVIKNENIMIAFYLTFTINVLFLQQWISFQIVCWFYSIT